MIEDAAAHVILMVDSHESHYKSPQARAGRSNVRCTCGSERLFVTFIEAPFTGCYLKVTCECGAECVLFDDYA